MSVRASSASSTDQAKRQTHKVASPGRRPQLSVHQGAKLLARTLGADNLSIGMLPAGQRRQPKARLPVAIQAGCIPTNFPAILSLHRSRGFTGMHEMGREGFVNWSALV